MARTPRPLFTADQIAARVAELAAEIDAALPHGARGDGLLLVGPLKGAVMLVADLARALSRRGLRVDLCFVTLSSYGAGTESSGTVTMTADLDMPVAGRHVLLVDDIVDTGRTFDFALRLLANRDPASIRTVALLDKPSRRVVDVQLDHVGFPIEDLFVIGYGTDLDQRYRELPDVRVLE